MADVRDYMASRFDLHGRAIDGAAMSGGKPVMQGPVARLPDGAGVHDRAGVGADGDGG